MTFKRDKYGRYFGSYDSLNYMLKYDKLNREWEVHCSEDHTFDRALSYLTAFVYLLDAKRHCSTRFNTHRRDES